MRTRAEKEKIVNEFNKRRWNDPQYPEIFEINNTGELFPVNPYYGINWSGQGTVSTNKAETFIEKLQIAMKVVKELNSDYEVEE